MDVTETIDLLKQVEKGTNRTIQIMIATSSDCDNLYVTLDHLGNTAPVTYTNIIDKNINPVPFWVATIVQCIKQYIKDHLEISIAIKTRKDLLISLTVAGSFNNTAVKNLVIYNLNRDFAMCERMNSSDLDLSFKKVSTRGALQCPLKSVTFTFSCCERADILTGLNVYNTEKRLKRLMINDRSFEQIIKEKTHVIKQRMLFDIQQHNEKDIESIVERQGQRIDQLVEQVVDLEHKVVDQDQRIESLQQQINELKGNK